MPRPLLVVIGYVWPEPNSSAAGSRILTIINFFRTQHWQIMFASAATISEHKFDLASIGVDEQSILLNDSSFDAWIKSLNPSAVLFDRFFTEEQFGWRVQLNCPAAMRLLDTEDFHGLRKIRQAILKKNLASVNQGLEKFTAQEMGVVKASSQELFDLMMADEAVQRELSAIYRCDLTLMVSQFEIDLLNQKFGIQESLLFYLPLVIDSPIQSASSVEFAARKDFVVIGNFRHEPNWDSVQLLKDFIWPRIRKKLVTEGVNANLRVCGAYPPPKATQLHKPSEGFFVQGWVEDAQAVMESARVCLAPLRFGAGQKGKLLLAMQMGTPSVTTRIGAEAMSDVDVVSADENQQWCGAVADEIDAFVDAACNLYLSESEWKCAYEKGYELIATHYLASHYVEFFWNSFSLILSELEKHRRNNVVGTLLHQQEYRASQYMGQWIQEKNKKQ